MNRLETQYEEEEQKVAEEKMAGPDREASKDTEPTESEDGPGRPRNGHAFAAACLLLPVLLCLLLAWQLYEAKREYLFLEEKYQEALALQERAETGAGERERETAGESEREAAVMPGEETAEEPEEKMTSATALKENTASSAVSEENTVSEGNADPVSEEETVSADTRETSSGHGEKEPAPFQGDPSDWRYLLVNEKNPLPQNYDPGLTDTRDRQQVDCRIVGELEEMLDAAREAGHDLLICSSYRDYEKQDELIDKSIARYMKKGYTYRDAFFMAKKRLALTGTSEHHTGLAVDIVGVKHQTLDAAQGATPEAVWLKEHCAEYGFILRYPAQKEDITGISGESWHFRYVGKEAAEYIMEQNLSLEEFVQELSAPDQ